MIIIEIWSGKKYIDKTTIAISVHYQSKYALNLVDKSQYESNREDELIAYIYKYHKIEKVKDEFKSYLNVEHVKKFDKNMTALEW